MKLLSLITLVLICLNNVISISVVCSFNNVQTVGYSCDVASIQIVSKSERNVTWISGSHQAGKGNGNVQSLRINTKIMNYLPRNIEEFFPNLEAIQVWHTNLVEVTVDDFKPFGEKLIRVHFDHVEVAVVEADLFKFNPNLEFISFYFSKVRHVDNGAFANLNRLTTLYFESNPCINANAVNDRTGVLSLINRVEVYCKDAYFDRQQKARYNNGEETLSSMESELLELRNTVQVLKQQVDQCNQNKRCP